LREREKKLLRRRENRRRFERINQPVEKIAADKEVHARHINMFGGVRPAFADWCSLLKKSMDVNAVKF